ncbi:uncharacterized protein V1516DRAFT_674172, partial [Lipomyces oligophaga]|uniref:uncharacterized protein n=1 Tax=Lipomyces oligophaga TaxID=45792 RepID=UPI0034CF99F5
MDDEDDFFVRLLVKEQRERTAEKSTPTVNSSIGRRPQSNLRPNTDFLTRVVKHADSHNNALIRKEAVDAVTKFRDFNKANPKHDRKSRESRRKEQLKNSERSRSPKNTADDQHGLRLRRQSDRDPRSTRVHIDHDVDRSSKHSHQHKRAHARHRRISEETASKLDSDISSHQSHKKSKVLPSNFDELNLTGIFSQDN